MLESQKKAKKNWDERNRAYSSYLKSRSSVRSFIRNKSTLKDLEEFKDLIDERIKIINAQE